MLARSILFLLTIRVIMFASCHEMSHWSHFKSVLRFTLDLYTMGGGYIKHIAYLVGRRVLMAPVELSTSALILCRRVSLLGDFFISFVISYRISSRSRKSGNDFIVSCTAIFRNDRSSAHKAPSDLAPVFCSLALFWTSHTGNPVIALILT